MTPNGVKQLSVRRIALSAAMVFAMFSLLRASDLFQPYRLVNLQTAGILPKASFDLSFRIYASPDGVSGLLPGVNVGLTNRLNVGLAYGGEGIIGYSTDVRWNRFPGILLKYRVIEEKIVLPALVIGFDNQGDGGLTDAFRYGYDGYVYKSPGFFVSLSKNYLMLKTVQIGFHGTANYSIEEANEVFWPNFAGGIDIGINEELMFTAEYDFALNDITGKGNDKNKGLPYCGFMNIGLRWAFTENFYIEFDLLDIFENKTRYPYLRPEHREPVGWSRELKVTYISKF